jgi:nicotinamide mononucleotide adenylyltransferase
MSKIAIIPGAFKPITRGHYELIRVASMECDEVEVFASLTKRGCITGSMMVRMWDELVKHTLPSNVDVQLEQSPITETYNLLENVEFGHAPGDHTYVIYGGSDDVKKNFSTTKLKKYVPRSFSRGIVVVKPIDRTSLFDTSGTQVRGFIESGDKASFMLSMPNEIDGEAAWNILHV